MKAEEFDKIFDDNEEDIIQYLDLSKAKRSQTHEENLRTRALREKALEELTAQAQELNMGYD